MLHLTPTIFDKIISIFLSILYEIIIIFLKTYFYQELYMENNGLLNK